MNTSINDICKVLLTIEMSHNHFNTLPRTVRCRQATYWYASIVTSMFNRLSTFSTEALP